MGKKRFTFGATPKARAKKPRKPVVKQKTKVKKPTHSTKFNVYSYDPTGRGRRIKTFTDKREARSWVQNKKAITPNAKFKVVPEAKKRLW